MLKSLKVELVIVVNYLDPDLVDIAPRNNFSADIDGFAVWGRCFGSLSWVGLIGPALRGLLCSDKKKGKKNTFSLYSWLSNAADLAWIWHCAFAQYSGIK